MQNPARVESIPTATATLTHQFKCDSPVKNVLLGWFKDGKATAYAPFIENFAQRLTPSEILHSIYRSLPAERRGDYQNGPQSALREGAAALISDAEVLTWHHDALNELLRFGGTIRSLEVLESITAIIGHRALLGGKGKESVAALAFQVVREAGYPGSDMHAFLKASERNVGPFGIDVCALLLAWAEHDPAHWADHVLRLAGPVYAFMQERMGDTMGERVLVDLAGDFAQALGSTTYVEQIYKLHWTYGRVDLWWLGNVIGSVAPDLPVLRVSSAPRRGRRRPELVTLAESFGPSHNVQHTLQSYA